MTGPEHYCIAEELLDSVTRDDGSIDFGDGGEEYVAAAQVHATLAMAAAFGADARQDEDQLTPHPATSARGHGQDDAPLSEEQKLADEIAEGLRAMADMYQANPHLAPMARTAFSNLNAPINAGTFDVRDGIRTYVAAAAEHELAPSADGTSAGVKIRFNDSVRLFVYNRREHVLDRYVDGVRTDEPLDQFSGDEQWLMPDFGIGAHAAPARGHGQDGLETLVLHAEGVDDVRTPRCGAGGGCVSLQPQNVNCDDCVALMVEQDVTGYSAEQLAGDACMVCGRAFVDGEFRDVIGGRRGRDVYAHYDCDDPSYDPTQPAPPTGETP